jgi:hypothetical protein
VSELPDIPAFLDRRNEAPVRQPLPQGFGKPLVYSFTMLNTADTCLHRVFRQYVKKDIPYVETTEMAWGNKVHSAFEYRLGGKPLPMNMAHWEPLVSVYADRKAIPEKKLGITREGKPTGFFDKDVFFRGKIDATMINGTNAFLPDWKTGNSKYEDPFELECQAVMLHAANPHLKMIGGHYVWLKENRVGQNYNLSDTRSTWARINNKVEVIEDVMREGEWTKTKGPLCGYCSVIDCEHRYDAKAGERSK